MIRAIPIFRRGSSLTFVDPGAGSPTATVLVCHRRWEERPRIEAGQAWLWRRGRLLAFSAAALLLAARARTFRLRVLGAAAAVAPRRRRPRTHQAALDRLACPETGVTLRPNRWARAKPRRARRRPGVKQAVLFPERQIELFGGE
jgi:hypothetical protein